MSVYIEICGGLGNQLFQLSFSKFLEQEFDVRVFIETDRVTETQLEVIQPFIEYLGFQESRVGRFCHTFPGWLKLTNVSSKLFKGKVVNRLIDGMEMNSKIFQMDCDWIYQDYAQNEIFARFLKTPLISYLGVNPEPIDKNILVHVRRGDMEQNPKATDYHGLVSLDKLLKNVDIVRNSIGWNTEALVMSDSFETGNLLSLKIENSKYVESDSLFGFDLLRRMIGAGGYVLSNSTLGWWAAFISTPKEVIAPRQWFARSEHPQIMVKDWTWN